ncbi:MAG TPA: lipid-A-disaccharide synthase [Planctomycetota bacterium]|nr:lipid-A-disaccharide synthase [Planctomycetota bacterium]HRU51836.1 lipid-A-disaccharide synthase [Planctomycetota bacterium]
MKKNIFFVSGDASGDIYGAQVIQTLQQYDPNLTFSGMGGDKMQSTGMHFLYNLVREFSVMGFLAIALGMRKVLHFRKIALDYIKKERPDLIVLIDYPGFNLHLASQVKKWDIPVVYYVTPQIWAWAPWRIKKIKKYISKMLVIFPFEVSFYQKANVPVSYVGHPLLDRIATYQYNTNFKAENNIISPYLALLPGSRHIEIIGNFPVMLWAWSQLNKQQKQPIPAILALSSEKYLPLIKKIYDKRKEKYNLPELQIIQKQTYDVLKNSHFALVTSGTATLETAILQTPMLVIYRVKFYHRLLKNLILQCKYFTLPNIIADKEIIPEYLVTSETPQEIISPFLALWNEDSPERKQMKENLQQLCQQLEKPGASEKVAQEIYTILQNNGKIQ